MRAMVFILTLIGISHQAFGVGMTIAFEDLPALVRGKNENVNAAHAFIGAQEQRTGRLIRSFLPSVSGQVGAEDFKSSSDTAKQQGYWKLEAGVNVYHGGRDLLEEEIRKSHLRLAKANYSGEFAKELKEARQTFWKIVAISQEIADREEALSKHEANIKSSRRRAGAGVSTAADTVQFELEKAFIKQEIKKLKHEEDILKSKLTVAVALDDHESLQIKGGFTHPEEGELQVSSLLPKDQLSIRALIEKERAERFKGKQSAQWWQPRVDLYSRYGVPALSDQYERAIKRDQEWAAGVRVVIDLGQGVEGRAEARAQALEAAGFAKQSAHQIREITALDHELRHDLKLLHELIHDAESDIGKSEEFFRLTQGEYARGVKNGPDLLQAFQKFYEFRKRRRDLYREYHETKAELLALVAGEAT